MLIKITMNETENPIYLLGTTRFRSRDAAMANKVDGVVCPFCVWIYVFNCKSLKCYFTQFSQRQGYFKIDSTLTN